jgi:DNA-binding MarR family transcriptional regulator
MQPDDQLPTAEDAFMATILELGRRMRQRLPGDELDYSLLPVLRVLSENGPCRHTALAERLRLDASTVSRKIRHLEERGMVRVSPDAKDGRARQVELLPSGARVLEQLLGRRRDLIGDVLEPWAQADRDLLHHLLARFNHDLVHSGADVSAATHSQEDLS